MFRKKNNKRKFFCSNCGSKLKTYDDICRSCGYNLKRKKEVALYKESKKLWFLHSYLLIILFIINSYCFLIQTINIVLQTMINYDDALAFLTFIFLPFSLTIGSLCMYWIYWLTSLISLGCIVTSIASKNFLLSELVVPAICGVIIFIYLLFQQVDIFIVLETGFTTLLLLIKIFLVKEGKYEKIPSLHQQSQN